MNLDGTWRPVSAKMGGVEFEESTLHLMELELADDNYTSVLNGQTEHGKIKITPGTSPMSVDIVSLDGPNIGKVLPAIFKLSGDQLTICYSLQPGARPTDFTSTAENKYFLIVYKRGH